MVAPVQAETLQDFKDFRKQVKKATETSGISACQERLVELEKSLIDDINNFYLDKDNMEFLIRTNRASYGDLLGGATIVGLSSALEKDKLQHITATFGINEVLKGITNEDKPFVSFMIMTVGKEVVWDLVLNKGNFSFADIAANAVIIPFKTDYKELYNDIKLLQVKNLKKNGIFGTTKEFFVNRRVNPRGLTIIKAKSDLLKKATLDLIKKEKKL